MNLLEAERIDDGLEEARLLAEEEAGISRKPTGSSRYVIPTIGVIWCFFQLSIASWLILDTVFIRAIHLGFAFLMVFLNYPFFKKTHWGLKFLSAKDRIPVIDYIVAIVACLSAIYIALDYGGINSRYGAPILRDIVIGMVLLILLLEASRRVIGPALSIIAVFFCLYAFLGPYMPDVISFKGVSLNRFVGQMSMSTEGIYGIPLDVSATIVFLFVLFGSMLEKAGAGEYFIKLALSLLGGFKGGPAKAAVLGSGLTGMVNGSSIANIVTTGTFTIPLMKRVGSGGISRHEGRGRGSGREHGRPDCPTYHGSRRVHYRGICQCPLHPGHQGRGHSGLRLLCCFALYHPYRGL